MIVEFDLQAPAEKMLTALASLGFPIDGATVTISGVHTAEESDGALVLQRGPALASMLFARGSWANLRTVQS